MNVGSSKPSQPNSQNSSRKASTPTSGEGSPAVSRNLTRAAMQAGEEIWLRRDIAKKNIYMSRSLIAVSGALMLSIVLNIIQVATPAKRTYFATTPTGALIPIVPLSAPIMDQSALNNWTVNAVTKAFTLTFNNWKANIQAAQQDFTPNGAESYRAGLEKYHILSLITSENCNLSAVVTGAPVITSPAGAKDNRGRAYWIVEFPMTWTYSTGGPQSSTTSNNVIAKVIVVREPQTVAASGLAIDQLLVAAAQ